VEEGRVVCWCLDGGAAECGGEQDGASLGSEHTPLLFTVPHPSRVERDFYSTTLFPLVSSS